MTTLEHEIAGCCAMGLCGPDAAKAAREREREIGRNVFSGAYGRGTIAEATNSQLRLRLARCGTLVWVERAGNLHWA